MTGSLDAIMSDREVVVDITESASQWVSFTDGDGDTWMFDLSFLTSNWTCIYGAGCLGIGTESDPEAAIGCCAHGAHFADTEDEDATRVAAARLTDLNWQHRPADLDRAFTSTDGSPTSTVVDGACIFLNRPGFDGGTGCALHIAAVAAGERPLDWKPDVCWQVPLRLDEHVDDNGHRTWMLRGWERRDWGAGGAEFGWWCTDDPTAFVEHAMAVHTLRDEIIELVGPDAYAMLVLHLDTLNLRDIQPHPGSVPVELSIRP